jgi:hypothetical protein
VPIFARVRPPCQRKERYAVSSFIPLIAYANDDSDRQHPVAQVPIIFLHTVEKPFCDNPRCECRTFQPLVEQLFAQAAKGEQTLAIIDISQQLAQCELLGHELVTCTIANAKVCTICSVLAYCPDCTPEKPSPTVIPLHCTLHARSQAL